MRSFLAATIARAVRIVAGTSIESRTDRLLAGGRIYIANHTSHLDFILIWSSLPPQLRSMTRPVAAYDYWACNVVRRYLAKHVFNALLIERSPGSGRETVAHMVEVVNEGYSLIFFPEGTRGSGTGVAPFKSGLFYLCQALPDLEVVPVGLVNPNRILPKGEFLPVPMLSRVVFGEPLALQPGEDRTDFLERARAAVAELAAAGP